MKKLFLLLAFSASLGAQVINPSSGGNSIPTANWYVDQSIGSDANSGSVSAPFATIRRAFDDNYLLYSEWVPNLAYGWTVENAVLTANTPAVGYGTWATMADNTTNGLHRIWQNAPANIYGSVFSVCVAAGTASQIALYSGYGSIGIGFNLSDGTTFTPAGFNAPSAYGAIASDPTCQGVAGARRFWIMGNNSLPGNTYILYIASGGAVSYAGTGKTIYWYGAQVQSMDASFSSGPNAYIRTANQVATTAKSGDVIAINGGTGNIYRESVIVDASYDHITLQGYGTVKPVVAGDTVIPSSAWTLTAGTTYQATVTLHVGDADNPINFVTLFENDYPLILASSLVNCEATPGTYYPSALTNGAITMYINNSAGTNPASNGNTYAYSSRSYVINLAGSHNTVSYLQAQRATGQNGSIKIGDNALLSNVISQDGTAHNILFGQDSTLINVAANYAYDGASASYLFVMFDNIATGTATTLTNISGVGARVFNPNASQASTTYNNGLLAHVGTSGSFGRVVINGATFSNVNVGIGFSNVTQADISGLNVSRCFDGYDANIPIQTISNSSINCMVGGAPIRGVANTSLTISNSTISGGSNSGAVINYQGTGANETLHLTNSVISTNSPMFQLIWIGDSPTFTASGNTYDMSTGLAAYNFNSTPTSWISNNNRFQWLPGTSSTAAYVGGVTTSLANVRSTYGQEVNSTFP